MRFYNGTHRSWCGIDLHAKTMYLCILDEKGQVLLHENLPATPGAFLAAIAPYRDGLVVAAERIFTWYWLADLCAKEGIPFVLGHALFMKAIHGGKAKNDRIDALKIATLLRGGMLPQAYVYPAGMRSTRDLLRRRLHLVRKRGQLLAHIQMTAHQYNLPPLGKRIAYPSNREGVADHFEDRAVKKSIAVDLALLERYDELLTELEGYLVRQAKQHDPQAFHRLRTIPGGGKMGNVHLEWAFSEAAVLFVRHCAEGKKLLVRPEKRFGKGKALSILAHKLGRAAYFMLARGTAFEVKRFAATLSA